MLNSVLLLIIQAVMVGIRLANCVNFSTGGRVMKEHFSEMLLLMVPCDLGLQKLRSWSGTSEMLKDLRGV